MMSSDWKMDKALKRQIFGVGMMVGFTLFVGMLLLMSNFSYALDDDVASDIAVSVVSACTLSSNNANPSRTIIGGRSEIVGPTTFTSTCNDDGGYAVYAIGYGGDVEGNTDLVASASLGSNYNIMTGDIISGGDSRWQIKIDSGNDGAIIQNGFSEYRTVPSSFSLVALKSSGTSSDGAVVINASYKVFISSTQRTGTYTGKVRYMLVHPNTACPDGYTLEGGVCTASSLTAITTMQAMTTSICDSATVGDTKRLKDTRDNKYYWVAKLADNNCWMTQNLDLDLSTSTALTPDDSDVTSSWTPTFSTYTSAGTWNWNYSYSQSESYDPGDKYLVTSGSTSGDTVYNSLSACTAAGNTEEVCQHGHSGNYYNWNAATAGSNASIMDGGDEAPQSICPKGWRLPYSTQANKSWYYLFSNSISGYDSNAATSQAMRTSPFYISRAGYYDVSVYYAGSGGYYWSSAAYGEIDGDYYAYYLYLYPSGAYLQGRGRAKYGDSVRCVSR